MADLADQELADRLDADIDALLAGPPAITAATIDPVLAALATLSSEAAPPDVHRHVRAALRQPRRSRPWWVVRAVAAVAAFGFLSQGVVALFAHEWLADLLHSPDAPHITREGGFLALGMALLLFAAVVRPHWMEAAMTAAVPLGLGLGVYGASEIPHLENPAGEYFHLSQAAAALFLLGAWVWARRRDAAELGGEDPR